MADKVKLSWDTIKDGIEVLALMTGTIATKQSPVKRLVGISRGGLIPATMLSHKIGVPLEVISVSAYEGTRRTLEKPIVVNGWKPEFNEAGTVIVDDILDSGDTYSTILHQSSVASRFTFLTLVNKDCERFGGFRNYFIKVPKGVWVQFPWETLDAPF